MLYKGPPPKAGINVNGKDILDYDPDEISDAIGRLPAQEGELVAALIKDRAGASMTYRTTMQAVRADLH